MTTPARIVWLLKGAYVVEHVHQAEYAAIVSLRNMPASVDEVEAWRDAEDEPAPQPATRQARGVSR
jgi:hypothetical protein